MNAAKNRSMQVFYQHLSSFWQAQITVAELDKVFTNSADLPNPFLQHIQAQESQLLQLVDLFTGAVGYKNRDLDGMDIKKKIIAYIEQKSGYKIDITSPLAYDKFNIFIQDPLWNKR